MGQVMTLNWVLPYLNGMPCLLLLTHPDLSEPSLFVKITNSTPLCFTMEELSNALGRFDHLEIKLKYLCQHYVQFYFNVQYLYLADNNKKG